MLLLLLIYLKLFNLLIRLMSMYIFYNMSLLLLLLLNNSNIFETCLKTVIEQSDKMPMFNIKFFIRNNNHRFIIILHIFIYYFTDR